MDVESELPLDIDEFRCVVANSAQVVIVFNQTGRRYTFSWRNGELALAQPEIEGGCGMHASEIVDCLARAVASRAARAGSGRSGPRPVAPRTLTTQLRAFLLMWS